jgi:hypothetical protein
MRVLLLLIPLTLCTPTRGEVPDTKILEGCWDNVDQSRERGHCQGLCFGSEDVTVFFWDFSGGLDYFEVQWAFETDSTIQIHNTFCKHRLEENLLHISECSFRGTFLSSKHKGTEGE